MTIFKSIQDLFYTNMKKVKKVGFSDFNQIIIVENYKDCNKHYNYDINFDSVYETRTYIQYLLHCNNKCISIETEKCILEMYDKYYKAKNTLGLESKQFNLRHLLYKILELLDIHESDFKRVTGINIVERHDLIWKQICNELDWKFIPETTDLSHHFDKKNNHNNFTIHDRDW